MEEGHDVESDGAEETMSALVLAKEIDEPDIDQPTEECQFRALPGESWLHDEAKYKKTVSETALECRESALTDCSTERAVVRKERSAIQVSRSHLCMMFVLLPRLFRLCRFVRLVRQIEQVRVVAKLYRCRNDLTRASGPAGRLGRDRGSFQQSDETAGILKQLKDRMSADLTAFLEKGLDRMTNHQDLVKNRDEGDSRGGEGC